MSRLPLDLYAEVTTADGVRHKWDANQAAGDRLRNFSFRTKIGDGFADAGGQLARRIDRDYPDLGLGNTVTVVGADGSVAYEGRLAAMPRELGDTHSIGVTLAGWMAHAKDRRFTMPYADRELTWAAMSRKRRGNLLAANRMPIGDGQAAADPTNNEASVLTGFSGPWATGFNPISEAWYDAGPGNTIAKVGYGWRLLSPGGIINPADANWFWGVYVSSDDIATAVEGGTNLRAAGPSTGQTFSPTARYRYGLLQLGYLASPGGTDGAEYSLAWNKLAVYGDHGLDLHVGEPGEPAGVYGSDVMRHIVSQWCPQLDPSGIEDSDYVIQHLAFKDRTFPYDAFLEINKFHLRHLGVWENRRLDWRPYDFTDYDWEIRTDDPGVTFSPQGPSTQDLFNAIEVSYTDLLTGTRHLLTADDYPELADTNPSNPWNQQGIYHPDDLELSRPTLEAQALQLGRAALAEKNRPKTPGTVTARGYVRNRAGAFQPVWKMRAGDTVSITSFPNDSIRLIAETDYDDEQKQIRLAIDWPFQLLEAYMDRVGNALSARGLA